MAKQRIEYIDALRGFCMILVVLYHLGMFSYGMVLSKSYYHIFNFFMLPLFFFVSGWCCYRGNSQKKERHDILYICRDKFKQLIVPSCLFMLLSIYVFELNIRNTILNEWKAGYWFTIVLFFFFVFYAILQRFLVKIRMKDRLLDVILSILAFLVFCSSLKPVGDVSGLFGYFYNGLSFSQWWYFLFFVIGIMVRKYFDIFVRLTDNQFVVAVLLAVFLLTFMCRNEVAHVSYGINVLVLGLSGTFLSFTFFRKKQSFFSKETFCGRIFQQIGIRTLDIYMIHYFLLPRHLDMVGRFLQLAENPVIEFFVSLIIAAGIISLCLLLSEIIRLSPWLAHVMLGAKKPNLN
ncbi:MAG: acyltransferase [Prevotella sp.]|nr:acyltransferase [Prevotella sp.]